ncbi:MAG: lipase-like domain-containing protein [Gammaproteobacteria bacterium]
MELKSKHIVFVHGLFGWGPDEMAGFPYFGEGLKVFEKRLKNNGCADVNVHAVGCGPVSSFHDRACEVFAQISGTQVDYDGKEQQHTRQPDQNHNPEGKDYSGKAIVQNWSEANPVILVGHSAGAHSCLQLQQLLSEKFWDRPDRPCPSSANWVEAVICISGVINGSTLPYMLGCDKNTGKLTGSVGEFIGRGVQILGGLNKGFARNLFDWDLDQWIGSETQDLGDLIENLDRSGFSLGKDNLAYDLTLQGCREANERFETDPNTYYLSVVTEQTFGGFGLFKHRELPNFNMNPALTGGAFYQSVLVDFKGKPIEAWGSTDDLTIEKWRENDGAVSSISQRYPFTGGKHPKGIEGFIERQALQKGQWYYEKAEDITGKSMDHLDVVFGHLTDPNLGDAHRSLYSKLCDRICTLK